MGLSGCNDQLAAAGRQRLAEALRANLSRRKAQKRDRAKHAATATAQHETVQNDTVQGAPAQGGTVTRAVPPQDD
ncbi:MAG: hypothetical protein WCA96_12115 [Methylocella sp.]